MNMNWKNWSPSIVTLALGLFAAAHSASAAEPRVIEITGNDMMKYSVTEITAKPGEALEVKMSNAGQVPKQAMAHNWVLLKPMNDTEIASFAGAAVAKAPDYIPDDKSAILAHTKMLGPKESDKVDFNAPEKPGEYPYICTFPGHFVSMRGKLIVK